jgi:hypothetical protein
MNSTLRVLLLLTLTGDTVLTSVSAFAGTGIAPARTAVRRIRTSVFMILFLFMTNPPQNRKMPALSADAD